ncbi:MAG: hypothetical protein E6K08_09455 [Methanobacteriota archaeon]|nr:MAG: hypothetical protein E6K08_09455 [Euryarchaeota archaeon]
MESRYANVRDADLRGSLVEVFRARYLALGLSLFLAMYVATKFVLVIFNATDPGERWPFDLTPFGALNLPDIQLALLSAAATGANAALHYSVDRSHRRWSLGLSASIVASLILALRASPGTLDMVVTRALRELQALVEQLPEEPTTPTQGAQLTAASATPEAPGEDYMRDLLTSMLEELEDEAAVRSARGQAAKPEEAAAPEDEERGPSLVERAASRFPRFRPPPEALLKEAKDLADRGKLEKSLKRLDWIADVDERFPGLWELAATIYDELGEAEVAAECRRRAAQRSRPKNPL